MNSLFIRAEDTMEAFKKVLSAMWESDFRPSDKELLREGVLLLEISGTRPGGRVKLTGGGKFELKYDYDKCIPGGAELARLEKIYWEDEFFGSGNKVNEIVNYLKKEPASKRAIAWFWNREDMDLSRIAACLVHFYCRIDHGKLLMVANFRANDTYKNLVIDLDMLRSVQEYIAEKLGLKTGTYFHFVDSAHLRRRDEDEIRKLYKKIRKSYDKTGDVCDGK